MSSDDPYYILATEIGERLAQEGYLVRTGAGPGIMDAVPVGWKRDMSRLSSSSMQVEQQTQGVSVIHMGIALAVMGTKPLHCLHVLYLAHLLSCN